VSGSPTQVPSGPQDTFVSVDLLYDAHSSLLVEPHGAGRARGVDAEASRVEALVAEGLECRLEKS
jgi:hypothetical protein